jgi:hypothetical protein
MESLDILYRTNEFKFSKYETMSQTFPREIPAQGLVSIQRLAFSWSLNRDCPPQLPRKNRNQYDQFWVTLQTKFVGLTQIRIFLDTHSLGGIKKLPKDMEGKTEEEKKRYIYASMIHMESMIESKERLEVFEIHIDHWTYPYSKERIKPWLKQKEEERKIMRKMDGIRYKAYK